MTGVHLLFGGIGAGMAMAVPVGPVAALCISVTLRRGPAHGLIAGLGAALGDGLFAAIAVFGFSQLLGGHDVWLRLIGGVILGWVALRRLRQPIDLLDGEQQEQERARLHESLFGPFLLAVSNPASILLFAAVLGGLGLSGVELGVTGSALVSIGVFFGALLWWGIVAYITGRLRDRSNPKLLSKIERFISFVLLVSAVGLVLHAMYSFACG